MKALGPTQLMEDVLARDLCVGCGACTHLCPHFVNYHGKTATVFSCTRETGRCHAFCPKAEVDCDALSRFVFGEPYLGNPIGDYRRVVLARAGDAMIPGNYQCGGTVSALVAHALEEGVISGAVLTDTEGPWPAPRLVTYPEDVANCAGSKYAASPTVGALNRAVAEGAANLGFVGTPCQVMAVNQMRANPTDRPGFTDPVSLVIGLFCTWSVDARKLADLTAEALGTHSVHKMDMPPPPAEVLVLSADGTTVKVPLSRVRPLVPAGCAICPDMTSEFADLSVGVVEGEPEWNTLVIRTQKGEDLVESAEKNGYLVIDRVDDHKLEHLLTASGNKKKRAIDRARDMGLLGEPDDSEGRAALRLRSEVIERIMAL